MCILIIQEYTDCSHYSTSIRKCPAFHKLQNPARGLFGALFGCAEPRRKDCGRIAHHHALSMPALCEKCVAKRNQSSRGGRPAVADTKADQDDHQDRKEKDARRQQRQQQHSERKLQAREKFAQTEAFKKSPARGQPAGAASSASKTAGPERSQSKATQHQQQKSSSHPQRQPSSRSGTTKTREGHAKKTTHGQRHLEEVPSARGGSARKGEPPPPPVPLGKPAHAQPAQPAATYQQHRGRFPVAVKAPAAVSRPAQGSSSSSKLREKKAPEAVAVAEVEVEVEVAGSDPHQLRRKPAKTYLNVRNQPLKPIPAPLPEYQVYLNAMPSLEERSLRASQDSGKSQATTASSSSASPGKTSRDSAGSGKRDSGRDSGKDLRKRSALASFGRAIGLEPPQHSPFSDDGSDLSFVCSDARKLTQAGQGA